MANSYTTPVDVTGLAYDLRAANRQTGHARGHHRGARPTTYPP